MTSLLLRRRDDLLHVTPTDGDDVFVRDEYELETGAVHRNAEVSRSEMARSWRSSFFGGKVRP